MIWLKIGRKALSSEEKGNKVVYKEEGRYSLFTASKIGYK